MADTSEDQNIDEFKRVYLDSLQLIERLHRRFLDVVKVELDRLRIQDINNIQSLILFTIGEEELTVGELTLRGCYHGSNVSYNLKKLVDFGYVSHRRSAHDRRSYRVKLTDKGGKIRKLLDDMFARHAEALESLSISVDTLGQANDVLLRLDRFWASQSDAYGISDKALSRVA